LRKAPLNIAEVTKKGVHSKRPSLYNLSDFEGSPQRPFPSKVEMGYNFLEGGERIPKMGEKKNWKVKTFTTELKIFQTIKELETLDERINRFIAENKVKKVISVSDTTTTDNSGATIGLIRVLTYEA
jgi:hypothetical protein